ncbi:MAG: 30S ribosomal protein S10, partial [Acidovorax sp.]|uniref:30S ribosomal protein S10 n=1 Tax=Acidovorax sp. TaxID=1872122 RepID=UPI003918925E
KKPKIVYEIHISFYSNNFYAWKEFYKKYKFLGKNFSFPILKKKLTFNKSPHIDSKSKDQYETRFYKGLLTLTTTNPNFDEKLKKLF